MVMRLFYEPVMVLVKENLNHLMEKQMWRVNQKNWSVMKHYHDWNELERKKIDSKRIDKTSKLPEFNEGLNVVRLLPNSTVSDEETSSKRKQWFKRIFKERNFYYQVWRVFEDLSWVGMVHLIVVEFYHSD